MINYLNTKLQTPKWLFLLMVFVFLFRIPSYFEPYAYGDEMIYLTLGEGVRQGVTLYSEIHDNKPPLLYLTAAVAGSVFWFRAILAIWHLVTIYIFWRLVSHLFPKNRTVQIVGTITFSFLTTIPSFEGNIANSEIFMVGFTMWGFYLLLKSRSVKSSVLAGVLFSIAALFKIPAAFEVPAILLYLVITSKFNWPNFRPIVRSMVFVTLGFIIPTGLSFAYYYFKGALWDYIVAAYLQNFGYLSSFRPDDIKEPFLVKNAPLLIRGVILIILIGTTYLLRKKLSKQFVFAFIWLVFTLFAVTLPERPYPHYLIQLVPSVSIMIGMLFGSKTIDQVLVIFPLTLTFLVPTYYKFWKYPSIPYYSRFINYVSGNISDEEYKLGFGENVPRVDKVSKFISETSSRENRIFVWGDNAGIYAQSRRLPPIKYTVDYHINDFSDKETVIKQLEEKPPVYVVVMPNSENYPGLDQFLYERYFLINEIDSAKIWKLFEPRLEH